MTETYYIELDTPPGPTRPDNLLPRVIEDTGLTPNDFEITSKFFGEWTFKLNQEKNKIYEQNKEKIAERIKHLYNMGFIRYASW